MPPREGKGEARGSRFLRQRAPGGEQRSCRQRRADGRPRARPGHPGTMGWGCGVAAALRRWLLAHGRQVQRCAGAGRRDGAQLLPSALLLPLPAPAGNFPVRPGERCGDPAVAQDFVSLKINTLEDTRASKPTVGPAGAAAACPQSPRHGRQCSLPSLAPAPRQLLAPRAPKLKGPYYSSLLSRAPSPSFPLR